MDFRTPKKQSKKSVLNLLSGKSNDFVSKFYSKPAIVVALYRSLNSTCREIVNRCLSHNPERFYEFENEGIPTQIENSKAKLAEYHVVSQVEGKYVLNPNFKGTFMQSVSKGIKPFFRIVSDENRMVIERSVNEDFASFIEIYNFILENEIRLHKNEPYSSTLNKTFKEILNKLNFQIRVINSSQEKNMSGFKFLVEPINKQVNIILLHYYEFLLQNKTKLFLKVENDVNFEQNLLEVFCSLNFLSAKLTYGLNQFDSYIGSEVVLRMLHDLSSVGLVLFFEKDQTFRVSPLLENYLNQNPKIFEQFKTNIIVETDFKMYVYSEYEFVEHFLGFLRRFIHKNQVENWDDDYLFD